MSVYFILGLIGVLFFLGIGRSGSEKPAKNNVFRLGNIGEYLCDAILGYFSSIGQENLSPLLFSELFAFSFFSIDRLLYTKQSTARNKITDTLYSTFDMVITKVFPNTDINYAHDFFDERVADYAEMIRAGKDESEILKKLNFYLSQANEGNVYKSGESPIIIGNLTETFKQKIDINNFYFSYLTPLLNSIADKC